MIKGILEWFKPNVKMKRWDTAGKERFKSMSVGVIKMVDGLIMVYSIASKVTFKNLDTWMKSVKDISDLSSKPVIIIGNKCDLNENREVSYEEGEKYAKNLGYHFYETSAKTGENVKEAFDDIFEQLYNIYEEEIAGSVESKKNEKLTLKNQRHKKKKCCN